MVVRAQLHFRPPGDAPQLTFIGPVAILTAGGGLLNQTLLAPPVILLQRDPRKIDHALRTHFTPVVFQRAHLKRQIATREQLRFRADLIDAVIGNSRGVVRADIITVHWTTGRGLSITPPRNIGVFCRPVSRPRHGVTHDKVCRGR